MLFLAFLAVVEVQLKKVAPSKPEDLVRKVLVASPPLERHEKSLLNSFPFNAQEHGDNAAHGEHGEHVEHGAHGDHGDKQSHSQVNPLIARQGYGEASEQALPDFSEIAGAGKKCVQKVMMVEETVWEDHETCDHSYDKRCHKSFTTTYQSQQEEECDEVFRKICYIEMVDVAHNVTTEVCRKPLVKDCDVEGETVCRTEYQSECWSKQIPHEVGDTVLH